MFLSADLATLVQRTFRTPHMWKRVVVRRVREARADVSFAFSKMERSDDEKWLGPKKNPYPTGCLGFFWAFFFMTKKKLPVHERARPCGWKFVLGERKRSGGPGRRGARSVCSGRMVHIHKIQCARLKTKRPCCCLVFLCTQKQGKKKDNKRELDLVARFFLGKDRSKKSAYECRVLLSKSMLLQKTAEI